MAGVAAIIAINQLEDEVRTVRWELGRARGELSAATNRLRELEREAQVLKLASESNRSGDQSASSTGGGQGLRSLQAKVAELEKQIENLKADYQHAVQDFARQVNGVLESAGNTSASSDVSTLQRAALDTTKSIRERVEALKKMRLFSPESRTPEVVRSMLDLMESTNVPEFRAAVIRHLKGAVPLELKDRLIRVLQSDSSEQVREEAAETLGGLRTDPSVRAALENAASSDPSEKVRREARKSLQDK